MVCSKSDPRGCTDGGGGFAIYSLWGPKSYFVFKSINRAMKNREKTALIGLVILVTSMVAGLIIGFIF